MTISAVFFTILPIGLILTSYGYIAQTLGKIQSEEGRQKAIATCSSHLTAVILFYGSAILRYLMPTSGSPLELILSIQYSVITPLVNPLIYSLRNKDVATALRRIQGRCTYSQKVRAGDVSKKY